MIASVSAASPMFAGLPKFSAVGWPPPAHRIATGSREMPMTVMTEPVTTGGKKCSSLLNTPESRKPITPATITAPKMYCSPTTPPPASLPMASIEATAANEVPCTSGSRAPIRQMPSVCSRVARPETSRAAVSRYARSPKGSPSAVPTISGTATTPAYMLMTCCRP